MQRNSLNIMVEEHVQFGMLLTFTDVVEECVEHPVTGEQTNCKEVSTPIDLTYISFAGSIRTSLEDNATELASFTFTKLNNSEGQVQVSLSKQQVSAVVSAAGSVRDVYSPRLRMAGYYDIITTNSSNQIRVMQGKVLISDGVTL